MSNERFFRCPHCRFPHGERETVCPTTGLPLVRRKRRAPTSPLSPSTLPGEDDEPTILRAQAGTDSLIGVILDGKYLVRSVLGRGGMGTVYEAEQRVMRRPVAIKVLHSKSAQSLTTLKRFLREAKIAAHLPHPNICQIFDYGTLPDRSPYIVMERLEGESLRERLRWEGPLRVAPALEYTCQVLGALSFAHKRNVVHRDIKPENIFLASVGRTTVAKVVDFGLSKIMSGPSEGALQEGSQLTKTGVTMGTPYYMAPEQAFGDRNLDARADVWAVGVTLYEALAGVRPFNAKTSTAVMKAIVSQPHQPLHELRAHLPDGLEAAIDGALTKDRNARYESASAFQRDLLLILRRLTTVKASQH